MKFLKSEEKNKNQFLKEETGYLKADKDEDIYKFEGIASSYGNVDSYGDIFLEGSLDECIGKTVPIMVNHSRDITKAIGYGVLEKEGKQILIKGSFIKDDEIAEKIVKLKNSGVPIKLSIGGRNLESRPYKKDGVTYRGISKAEILETSVVFRGANPNAQITKSEEENMDEILKELQILKDKMKKSEENESAEILKSMKKLEEKLEKMNGLSDEDKSKIAKMEELEAEIKKQAAAIDEMMKKGVDVSENETEIKKHDAELNVYCKTGVVGEIVKKSFTTAEGGALIPQARANEIIKEVMETSPVIMLAKRYTIGGSNGNSLKIPVRLNPTNNAAAQAENKSAGAASEMTYQELVITAGKITDWVNVSSEMIEDSDFNVLGEVTETLGENIAELISNNVWRGTLSVNNEIEGIYNNTQATTTALEKAFTWESLIDLIYSMTAKVRAKSAFVVSTSALAEMRKFKDADGNPLYTNSLVAGEPGIFAGYRVYEDPYMDSVAAGKYPVFFGDMKSFYAWLDRKGMYMERDRKANTDGWDFYARVRIGGRVRQFTHGKLLKIPAGL